MKVFWSWQSDTPGKTGRHFIRECLLEAIQRIQASDEIVEPTERDARDALHLDQDRQGVTGSPDLANLILTKIGMSEVVVADVTPVSKIPAKRSPPTERRPEKRNMNPNVAIELGYALSALSSEAVLMVLNLHYGKREHLPFDLAHKAGPLTYRLAPEATADEIGRAKIELAGQLVSALRPFIRRAVVASNARHIPIAPVRTSAFYFDRASSLVSTEDWHGQMIAHHYKSDPAFYLRVVPVDQLSVPLSKSGLAKSIQEANLCTLTRSFGGGSARANQFGAVVFEDRPSQEGELHRSTQVFESGELWGINTEFVVARDDHYYIPSLAVEQMFSHSLPRYLAFASERLRLGSSAFVIAGGSSLEMTKLAVRGYAGSELHQMLGGNFEHSATVSFSDEKASTSFLTTLFERMWDLSGLERPKSDA